jgi:hypothetical protein
MLGLWWIRYAVGAAAGATAVAFVFAALNFLICCLQPVRTAVIGKSPSRLFNLKKKNWKGKVMTQSFSVCLTMICVSAILAGCQSAAVSGCSPFVKNNLSPAGTVALLTADRPGAERVIGNDRAGARKGCWE